MDGDLHKAVAAKAAELGKLVVRMTTGAGSGHPSSALSLSHIVTALMYHVMRYDRADPWNRANDRLVLSEGHNGRPRQGVQRSQRNTEECQEPVRFRRSRSRDRRGVRPSL